MLREHNDGTHKQYLKCYKEIGGHASDDGEINDRLEFQYSENLITIDGVDAKSERKLYFTSNLNLRNCSARGYLQWSVERITRDGRRGSSGRSDSENTTGLDAKHWRWKFVSG